MEKLNKEFTPRVLRLVGACSLALGVATVADQAVAAYAGAAKIANTKHNLGSTGTQSNKVSDTAEICVFCHTPHAANISNTAAPLWNKNLPATSSYTTYNGGTNKTSTMDSQVLGVGSVSAACLSCHDGTQAMDNIINAPGSGGYTSDGGGTNGLAYTWGASTRVDSNGKLTSSNIANLSQDLTNDHPIGIKYCGGGPKDGAATATCADPDFHAATNNGLADVASGLVWWVDSAVGTASVRDKTDMILFNRTFVAGKDSTGAGTFPSVECASCHDVHGGEIGTVLLRVSNSGSAVCLACHDK